MVLRSLALQTICNPNLDDRLAHDAQPGSLAIERFDHPAREVDIDALLLAT
jgi:hypothetical protein